MLVISTAEHRQIPIQVASGDLSQGWDGEASTPRPSPLPPIHDHVEGLTRQEHVC